jgi:1-deoxy-D-xylulose-5-phosphate reductoisomerase
VKKKIAIIGSTGSIGKTLLKIINKDKKNFDILLLTARKNYKVLLNQAKIFKVRNLIITDKKYFQIANSKNLNKKINIYNSFNELDKMLKKN